MTFHCALWHTSPLPGSMPRTPWMLHRNMLSLPVTGIVALL